MGTLPVDRILTHYPEDAVKDVMLTEVLRLSPLEDVSDAAQAFERYDLVSAPVVDEAGRLVGRLTVNEVVDVIREESDEEAYGAVGLDDDQDIFDSVWSSAKARWVWLGVNLFTAFFASRVISAFDGTIEKVVALAFFNADCRGYCWQLRQPDTDTAGPFPCYRSDYRSQPKATWSKRSLGGFGQWFYLGHYCRSLYLGALLRLSGRHEARLYHVLGHDAEYAHGRDCGYPRSDYA